MATSTTTFYFNNPVDYTAHIKEDEHRSALQNLDIILATGQDDPNRWSNEQLSANLWNHGIGNAFRLWDGWAHDWPWWHQYDQNVYQWT